MKTQKTWWGESFIHSLESFIDSGRLQRGRAYRTDNRVLNFEITNNIINATVRGNINLYFGVTKEPKYKISLAFNVIEPAQWSGIITNLCNNPGWLSKLMLNEMPSSIENAFEQRHFLPKSYHDIDASCSCPDYANPCKHIAGIYYRLANILDSNPMLLFQLRGLAPKKLHQALKKTELGKIFSEHISAPDRVTINYQQHKYSEFKTLNKPKNISQSSFWTMSEWPEQKQAQDVTHINAALIKKQGDHPEFWPRHNSFIGSMEDIYSTIKRKNKKTLS